MVVGLLSVGGFGGHDRALAQGHVVQDPGEALFNRSWVSNDIECLPGDGLGPMHNATSCVACHWQGEVGGGGPSENNVDLLSIVREKEEHRGRGAFEELAARHPAFKRGIFPTILLHKFGPEADYPEWREKLLGVEFPSGANEVGRAVVRKAAMKKQRRHSRDNLRVVQKSGAASMILSQRNTPALFGAGLIDSIPDADLVSLAESQAQPGSAVSGRVSRTPGQSVGKFGWRGQVSTLKEFVVLACVNELGFEVDGVPQPANPRSPHALSRGTDLNELQLMQLHEFVRELPRPQPLIPVREADRNLVAMGKHRFEQIGCGDCHTETVGAAKEIFSDLLLHDMGQGLIDPDPGAASTPFDQKEWEEGRCLCDHDPLLQFLPKAPTPVHQEWRTPPLWGVRDSAPYLHDGRAATLMEAIEWHGGEAESSVTKFRALPAQDRTHVIVFLRSLAAPRPPTIDPAQQISVNWGR
jgi:CxxC motif-containing protein (DUF1111 family)